jgi:molybdopterin-guanine dinucleotide biosynthesis protein B
MRRQPVLGIVGWKNSGKTTLVERLVAELTRRSWRISTVKHAHHGFDIDRPGSDSFRHRAAGAGEVLIASANRWALMHEAGDAEPSLEALIERLAPCDLVIVEGWKRDSHPKIEVRRTATRDRMPLAGDGDAGFIAIAADHAVETDLPFFDLDAVADIADFVERHFALGRK